MKNNDMGLDFEKLYNAEVKMKFLESEMITEEYMRVGYYYFLKASRTEKQLNKDMYDMTLEEMEALLYDLESPSTPGIMNNIQTYDKYCKWAIDNGLTNSLSNFTVFDGKATREWSRKFLADYKYPVYRREDILEIISGFQNEVDKAMILCLYEGISGEGYSELLNLKVTDLFEKDGKYYVKVFEERKEIMEERIVEISSLLYRTIQLADREDEYITGEKTSQYMGSDRVFKKSVRGRGRGDNELTFAFVSRKFTNIYKDHFGDKRVSPPVLQASGKGQMAEDLARENEGKLTTDMLKKIGEQYDTVLTGSGGYKYRNTTRIRDTLKTESLRKVFNYEF